MPQATTFELENSTALQKVTLDRQLGAGGAGSVFQVRGASSKVVKVYHDTISASDLVNSSSQIKAMVLEPPDLPPFQYQGRSYVQIAWPEARLFRNGKFVGFSMPALELNRTKELEYLLQDKQAAKHGLKSDMGVRVTIARQLSSVVAALHAKGHYVIDLKPLNLSYYPDTLYMAVLDCDGFSIHDKATGKNYRAPMFTPEYLAPEFQYPGGDPNDNPEAQDRFALAVVVFQLLCHGDHPYSGVLRVHESMELSERIARGYFPYGRVPNPNCDPRPFCTYKSLPGELLDCFDRAFGSDPAKRPSAREWLARLEKYANPSTNNLVACKANHQHRHFAGLPCSQCARESRRVQTPLSHGFIPRAATFPSSRPPKPSRAAQSTRSLPLARPSQSPQVPQAPRASQQKQSAPKPAPKRNSKGVTRFIGFLVLMWVGWHAWQYFTRPSPSVPEALASMPTQHSPSAQGGSGEPHFRSETPPSFDCAKAHSSTAIAICSNSDLSQMDAAMGRAYRNALVRAPSAVSLRDSQRQWLRERARLCGSNALCIGQFLKQRTAQLQRIASLSAVPPPPSASSATSVAKALASVPAPTNMPVASEPSQASSPLAGSVPARPPARQAVVSAQAPPAPALAPGPTRRPVATPVPESSMHSIALKLVSKGEQAYSEQNYSAAIANARAALEVDPSDVNASRLLQQAQQAQQNALNSISIQ